MKKIIPPIIAAILFAFVWIAGKYLADTIPPITMTFLRYCFTVLVFTPVLWQQRKTIRNIPRQDWPYLFAASVFGVIAYHALFYWALHFSSPTTLALIHAINPLLTLVLAYVILKQAITNQMILGFGLGIIGVIIVVGRGQLSSLTFNVGEWLMLAATLAWALFTIMSKQMASRQIDSLLFTALISLIGWLLLLPASLWEVNIHFFQTLDIGTWISLMYMGIGSSGLGYWLYSRSVGKIGPATTSFVVYSTVPIVVAIEEVLWFNTHLQFSQLLGFIFICAGLAVALYSLPWHYLKKK